VEEPTPSEYATIVHDLRIRSGHAYANSVDEIELVTRALLIPDPRRYHDFYLNDYIDIIDATLNTIIKYYV